MTESFSEGHPLRVTPAYADLPASPDAPAGSSWGLFGPHDEIGAINLLDDAAVLRGTSAVRRGAVFALSWDLEQPSPSILGREPYVRHQIQQRAGTDDRIDNFHPQASSQWDALKHAKHPEVGYYNGHATSDVESGTTPTLGIQRWAQRGIVGPFTLLDLERYADRVHTAGGPRRYTVGDLEAVVERQGVSWDGPRILLLRTGWIGWYRSATESERIAAGEAGENIVAPGLAAGEDMARWLWDHQVVAVASDAPALEAVPFDQSTVDGFLHYRLIALLGIAVGELFDLDALATDCATDGRYDGLFTAAPFNLSGGSGSPANALAVK